MTLLIATAPKHGFKHHSARLNPVKAPINKVSHSKVRSIRLDASMLTSSLYVSPSRKIATLIPTMPSR